MLLLEVEHLSCSFHEGHALIGRKRRKTVLRDITFSLEEGESFGLLGPSGSGKSTIARCIAGLQEPDGGEIRFAGTTLWSRGKKRSPDPRIQLLFQASSLSLDPKMKILSSIEEGFVPLEGTADGGRETKKDQ